MTSNTSAISPSITALLEIMSHEAGPMRRRLDASEALLTYETPPEVAEYTKSFLTSVIEDRERVTADTRLRASTLLRRVEAKRIDWVRLDGSLARGLAQGSARAPSPEIG